MNNPTVSILIPCYNSCDWIEGAVESALNQTYQSIEVLVVDDGSIDGSAALLRQFGSKIGLMTRGNRGGNPTRNELLAMSKGEWIQFLDADDYLTPEKIARQINVLSATKDPDRIDVIYSPVRTEHHEGRECVRIESPRQPLSDDPWILHAQWALTQTGGALFRKAALEEVGGWNEKQARCQDNELFLRLLQGGKIFLPCRDAVAVYRRFSHGTVSSGKGALLTDEILRILTLTESHLRDHSMLTEDRLTAINDHRFRLARGLWLSESEKSRDIVKLIRCVQPDFKLQPSSFAPKSYRICFRFLGFEVAEVIAAFKRRVIKKRDYFP